MSSANVPKPDFQTRRSAFLALAIFLSVVIGVGFVIGFWVRPDAWYESLSKPSFNPPNALFAPVWTVLYGMIALSGWLIWRVAPKSKAMCLWGSQMLLNWLWTPTFFWAHQLMGALALMVALFIVIALYIFQAQKLNKIAASLFIPYILWIGFAMILNASLAWMNG